MKSTYINDNLSSLYPFAADVKLPFPLYCIAGCGVCLAALDAATTTCPQVYMVSLQISRDGLVAVLSDGNDVLTTVGWQEGSSNMSHSRNSDYAATGWICPGRMDPACYGTYTGRWRLCDDVVTFLPKNQWANTARIRVNGEWHDVPQVLKLDFDGFYETGELQEGDLVVSGNVPSDAVTTVQDTVYEYSKVKQINELPVSTAADFSATLTISLGEGISASVINAHRVSEVVTDAQDASPRTQYSPYLFTGYSDTVIVTVNGNQSVPNCYDTEIQPILDVT